MKTDGTDFILVLGLSGESLSLIQFVNYRHGETGRGYNLHITEKK